jgi:hypothetical protein
MMTIIILLIGMCAGALLAAVFYGIRDLRREIAELRKESEAGKKRLPQNAENNLLNALAVILDTKMNLDADQLRLGQAMKILFAVRDNPFGGADDPAGPRPKGMKIEKP